MLIVTPDTIWNPGALQVRQLPRRFLGRVTPWPRRGGSWGLWARLIFEVELLRYLAVLLPFILGAVIWQDYALAISQAPIPMIMLVYAVETRFLRVPKSARAALIDRAEAERGLDLLRVRATSILTKIAAGRGMAGGTLHLVVEQSDMARIAPLTFVSVQSDAGPEVVRLSDGELALIRDTLFDNHLTEAKLALINLSENMPLRDVALEVRAISSHARLAAMIAGAAGP